MINVHFQRKIASDELYDTLFFATGEYPKKTKTPEFRMLNAPGFEIKIMTFKRIVVNGDKCTSVSEAKYVVQDLIR
jgi:hypothetical protein